MNYPSCKIPGTCKIEETLNTHSHMLKNQMSNITELIKPFETNKKRALSGSIGGAQNLSVSGLVCPKTLCFLCFWTFLALFNITPGDLLLTYKWNVKLSLPTNFKLNDEIVKS